MRLLSLALAISCLTMTSTVYSANGKGTEFDQYLLEKNILDPQFKIKNKIFCKNFNEIHPVR